MKTLTLTSPPTSGPAVKTAQKHLRDFGCYGGAIDGIFGPVTAAGSRRAKQKLGYPTRECTPTYGASLDAYLTGKRRPSPAMRLRAKRRAQAAAERADLGTRTADVMVRWFEEGWREQPSGSNRVAGLQTLCRSLGLSTYYSNMGYPWCALAVFVAALTQGSKAAEAGLKRGLFNALYTPEIRQVAAAGRHGLTAVSLSKIKKGIAVEFDFGGSNGGEVDHIGIALGRPGEKVVIGGKTYRPRKGQVVCVEGNTSYDDGGSQANGGAVAVRVRDLTLIKCAIQLS